MRAYVSDRIERIVGESRTIDGTRLMTHEERIEGYGLLAEREARAILAETEPDIAVSTIGGTLRAEAGFHVPPAADYCANERAALAESLSAFIEQEL
jgi:hypothetical protein